MHMLFPKNNFIYKMYLSMKLYILEDLFLYTIWVIVSVNWVFKSFISKLVLLSARVWIFILILYILILLTHLNILPVDSIEFPKWAIIA